MLVTCATFNYLEMLTLLLASHAISNPDIPLHVHAIDWPETALVSARLQYPGAVFHPHGDLAGTEPEVLRGPVPRTARILKLKLDIIQQAFLQSDKAIIWVDADRCCCRWCSR